MGKPIDFAAIEKMMANKDDWYSDDEIAARSDAALKKALGVTGPKVTVVDWKRGAEVGFRIDVDFDTIEVRG